MTDTRTLTREQLLHLVDRARRGVILPTELDDLHGGIVATCDRVEFYDAAASRMRDRAEVATVHAEKAETAHRAWETRTLLARERVTELEADVARLTAGQCIHHVGIHTLHHTTPVTGCRWCTTTV